MRREDEIEALIRHNRRLRAALISEVVRAGLLRATLLDARAHATTAVACAAEMRGRPSTAGAQKDSLCSMERAV
jgi:hypothetical protein